MKLKSKLISTIVSMCAAIAVMGVGVWASTSQSFQVTVKNDIEVKILSVDADIYGEFAVFSQFVGHTEVGKTNTFAQYYQNTNTGVDGFQDRYQKDHGYLLYASDFGGYNDGKEGVTDFYGDSDDVSANRWYETNVEAAAGSGYYKYITEAKQGVYFATAKSEGIDYNGDGDYTDTTLGEDLDQSGFDRAPGWAADRYNIDYTTHVAQITYMYTIRQWKMASASAATNSVDIALSDATNENLNQKLTDSVGNAGVYIDAYITRATDTGATENTAVNGAGKTTAGNYSWYPISLEEPINLPGSTINETFYIVLTYTFARNSANLDLASLADAVQHRIVMASVGELDNSTSTFDESFYPNPAEKYGMPYNDESLTAVRLNYATGLSTVAGTNNSTCVISEHGYNIVGSEFNPDFSPARALSTMSADQRSTVFAAYRSGDTPTVEKDNDLAKDTLSHSNILNIPNAAANNYATNVRAGYIFASNLSKDAAGTGTGDTFEPIIIADEDNNAGTSGGSTGWYVKQLLEGNTVPSYTHTAHDAEVTQPTP